MLSVALKIVLFVALARNDVLTTNPTWKRRPPNGRSAYLKLCANGGCPEALDELRELYDGDPIEDDWTEIRDEMEAIRHKIGELMDRIGDIGADCDSEEDNQKLGAIQSALGDAHGLILNATP